MNATIMILRKWILPIIGGMGILLAVIYVSTSTPKAIINQPLVQPAAAPFQDYIGGSGLTEPSTKEVAVATNVAGVIREIYVKVNDNIKKGDPLLTIDDRIAKAQLFQAEAKLLQAEAELKDAKDQMNIIASIKDKRAISQNEYNQKKNALEIAKTKFQISQAEVKSAKINLELCLVRAPLDGVIMTLDAKVGEYATTGALTEPLIRMGNLDDLYIRIDIDEHDAWRFKEGAKAVAFLRGNPKIEIPLTFVRTEPYVRPKRSLTGASIERVDTRVLQVIYRLDKNDTPIYPGQQMDVYLSSDADLKEELPKNKETSSL